MATKRELYEATEYIEKMDLMIAKLRTTKPGELAGKVGKNEILMMRRDALQQLVKDGYTVAQIAEAMKNDVFGILPKTITEIVNPKKPVKVARTRTVKAATVAAKSTATVGVMEAERVKQNAAVAGAPAAGSRATFEVKPDRKDL